MTTTKSNPALPCPEDKVNRKFKAPAPNILWVADFTYVRTAVGFVYVAFIIDVFARLCCINGVRDSLFESSVVAQGHEQLVPYEIQN